MTLADLGNIGEFVGALGVVASLIYLALQIRQNTRQLRNNARAIRLAETRAATDAEVEFRRFLLSNPEIDDARRRGRQGAELDTLDARRFEHVLMEVFLRAQTHWYQAGQSVVAEAYWDRLSRIPMQYLSSKAAQQWWSTRRVGFHPSFAEDIDRRLQTQEPAA